MSDERLRKLERRWKETGAVEDEAAHLLERVRSDSLEPRRLELAAFCGSQAARTTLGRVPDVPAHFGNWSHAVCEFEKEASVRAASAAANWLLGGESGGQALVESVRAAEWWIACPCDSHAKAALSASPLFSNPNRRQGFDFRQSDELVLCTYGASLTYETSPAAVSCLCRSVWENEVRFAANYAAAAIYFSARGDTENEAAIRVAVQMELTQWALGYSDPVRERVEARSA